MITLIKTTIKSIWKHKMIFIFILFTGFLLMHINKSNSAISETNVEDHAEVEQYEIPDYSECENFPTAFRKARNDNHEFFYFYHELYTTNLRKSDGDNK